LHWQQQGAERLHLVDLDGAFSGGGRHLGVAGSIFRALDIPVQFGGGLRSLAEIDGVFEMGAARAIVGTMAVESPDVLDAAVRRYPGAIIVAIDARHRTATLRGWVGQSGITALDLARRVKELGVGRIIYTDVSRDGLLRGVNLEETESIARESGLRVVASGGVAGVEDVRALWERRSCGIEGVILGRALYERRLDFRSLSGLVRSWEDNAG
jgi:phosphoribosylformimino-5-aminoimidazole carboxamide ribotide isomerase